ncbi:MAG: YihA family ribosome biogenesis GTP-binding protein [Nitrospirae bacterium]|nr:MAG: YihA family ribosome biogenesis GTP-binding protein [Nitrospirota bacterium]
MSREVVLAADAAGPRDYPEDGLPEVAFAGRSNVGKSSLINALVGRRRFARTSNTPGRTQRLHFYRVEGRLHLVDLPGYGYARVPLAVKRAWGPMVRTYLAGRATLVLVVQVVDLRHPPSREDRQLAAWLADARLPWLVAATKADKVARGRRAAHLAEIAAALELEAAGVPLLPVSALRREGVKALWRAIEAACRRGRPTAG